MQIDTDKIRQLINISFSLKKEDKARLLAKLHKLSDSQIQEIMGLLIFEQKAGRKLDQSYKTGLKKLKEEYSKIKINFEKKKIPAAIKKVAKTVKKKDEREADRILDKLNVE